MDVGIFNGKYQIRKRGIISRISLIAVIIICLGCSVEKKHNNILTMYNTVPPIADVNPDDRHAVAVQVPTKLHIQRTPSYLSISIDEDSLEPAAITVGSNMVTGVKSELFVYPIETTRPECADRMALSSGTSFKFGTDIFNRSQDGIPLPGKKYIVEMQLSLFETDIPAQHTWIPESSHYKVLWEHTLKQIVE